MRHIEPWFIGKAEPHAHADGQILQLFWEAAQAAHEDLDKTFPLGHFEVESGVTRIQSYRNEALRFACLRVVAYERTKVSRVHTLECVLAYPETKPPLVAIRAWCTQLNGTRISSGIDEPPLWAALAAHQCLGAAAPHAHLPYFDELLATVHQAATAGQAEQAGQAAEQVSIEEYEELESECAYYQALALEQANTIRELEAKQRSLQGSLAFKEGNTPTAVEPPEKLFSDLKELPLWAVERQQHIVLHPRAFLGAKRSLYQSDEEIFAALEFLAGPYRLHRSGEMTLAEYQQQLSVAGFRFAGAATYGTATAQGDAYFVRYKGRRQFLDMHIVKGGGRDQRYCLRIYFFWDSDDRKVVVGWLPSHLDNSLS